MSGKDFVSFLVDETFKLRKSGKARPTNFELRLSEFGLTFFKGQFIPQLQILRFYSPQGNLDIPVNWSLFSIDEKFTEYCVLDELQDVDHFFSVVKVIWNRPIEKLLITHEDGICYLIGFSAQETKYLQEIISPVNWQKTA